MMGEVSPVRLEPQGPLKRDPLLPHEMQERLMPAQTLFVLCHLGVPRLDRDRWSLTIDGLVDAHGLLLSLI